MNNNYIVFTKWNFPIHSLICVSEECDWDEMKKNEASTSVNGQKATVMGKSIVPHYLNASLCKHNDVTQ